MEKVYFQENMLKQLKIQKRIKETQHMPRTLYKNQRLTQNGS